MDRRLTLDQIKDVCRDLLRTHRRVTVRLVMSALRTRFGTSGRTARVTAVLSRLSADTPLPSQPFETNEIANLQRELYSALERAQRAEALERAHQDFWARRYADKQAELEARWAEILRSRSGVDSVLYLRARQRIADLERRLSELEDPTANSP